jgi:hypothetical protein
MLDMNIATFYGAIKTLNYFKYGFRSKSIS